MQNCVQFFFLQMLNFIVNMEFCCPNELLGELTKCIGFIGSLYIFQDKGGYI
jgi:hypothetical protein